MAFVGSVCRTPLGGDHLEPCFYSLGVFLLGVQCVQVVISTPDEDGPVGHHRRRLDFTVGFQTPKFVTACWLGSAHREWEAGRSGARFRTARFLARTGTTRLGEDRLEPCFDPLGVFLLSVDVSGGSLP